MSNIPFIDLSAQRDRLGTAIVDAVTNVINHGKYIMGPEVGELEAALSDFCGAGHTVSCSSGTDALMLPLMVWGVGPGDAVFVPTFTFAATAEVVALLGATPVFVDVTRDTFNMDVESLKAAISEARSRDLRPVAIIPVDLFGQPADYSAISTIAKEEDMRLLADAAQSFGAKFCDEKVGTIGDATATSFFPAKPLGCYGDGGAVFTDNDELAAGMRSLRVHGKGTHKYDNARIGLNARMDTVQAAVVLEKLKIFADEIVARKAVADRYNAALGDHLTVPVLDQRSTSAWAQYTVLAEDRDALATALKENGIPTAVYYPLPLHRQTAYRDYPAAPPGMTNSDYLSEHVISLPMHPYLEADVQDRITGAILSHLQG